MRRPLFLGLMALSLTACSGGEAATSTTNSEANGAHRADAQPALHLRVTGTSGTYMRQPSCMTELVVENLSDKPLMLFNADFSPTDAVTGKPLEVVLSMRAGVPYLSPTQPLAPGERGEPWRMNVAGVTCDQVHYTLGPINCSLLGRPCLAATAEQQGLAGITPVRVAPPPR
jgi:hypothetical protein